MYKTLKTFVQENFSVKFFLSFTLVMLAVSFLLASLFIHHQGKVLWNHLTQEGKMVADMLAYNSRLGVYSENKEMLNDISNGAFNQKNILAVAVFSKDRENLIVKTRHPKSGKIEQMLEKCKHFDFQNTDKTPIIQETIDEIEYWIPVYSRSQYSELFSSNFEATTTHPETEIIGYCSIIVSKENLNKQMNTLFMISAGIAILFWLSGSALMFGVVKGMTDPLHQLTKAVHRMGETGHLERIEFNTKDEMGKLSQAFNNMSEAINQREIEKSGLEEQLRQAQKMEAIGTLAGGIAHDFNNILGAIHGFSELGLLEVQEGSVIYNKLKEIDFATNRAADLVTQILTFSRQKDELRSPIFIGTIAKEVLKLLNPSVPPNIQISQDIDPNCGMVLSNAATIHQIIMNLCTNALYAMKRNGGILFVRLEDLDIKNDKIAHEAGYFSGMYQRLTVKDEGQGIAEDIMDQIFDPFFTTKAGEGTGMGLSVVLGIVTRHEGFIHVDSSLAQGSTFYVYLPLVDLEEIPNVPPKAKRLPVGSGNILLVEDDEQLIESTGGMLESLGYKVEKRMKSKDALEYFRNNFKHIDLVITDMAMPELNGVGLASEMHRLCRDFPIILTTGYSQMIDEEKALSLGFKGFLLKPIKRQTLAFIVKKITSETHS